MMFSKVDNRDRLLRLVRGENLNSSVRYSIDYSVDLSGNITIWGGMEFVRSEMIPHIDNPKMVVQRRLVPLYEYHRLSPYTARIYQMEEDISRGIPDERLIEEFKRFREQHQTDGFGRRLVFVSMAFPEFKVKDEQGREFRIERDDESEVKDRLLKHERQEILRLWGVDCPPEVNDSLHYGQRMSEDKGQVSQWFRTEFERIGGDYSRLWGVSQGIV